MASFSEQCDISLPRANVTVVAHLTYVKQCYNTNHVCCCNSYEVSGK